MYIKSERVINGSKEFLINDNTWLDLVTVKQYKTRFYCKCQYNYEW